MGGFSGHILHETVFPNYLSILKSPFFSEGPPCLHVHADSESGIFVQAVSSANGTMDINNIKFYNGVVLPVPEVATASLSLLGLAAC